MKTNNSIKLSLIGLILIIAVSVHAQTDTILDTPTNHATGPGLFKRADAYDKAVREGKIKINRLPQILPHTGYDPSAGASEIHQMPTRSKADKGIMEGQDTAQYRAEAKQQEQATTDSTGLRILITTLLLASGILIWMALPEKKPENKTTGENK